ncbi:unnamed protein product [Boreogadus saida]
MSFLKVKEEEVERETGAFGWTEDAYEEFRRASQEAREGLREAARKLAADAGLSSLPARPEREPAARDLFQKRRGHVSTGGGAKTHFPQKQTSSKLQGRRWWWVDSVLKTPYPLHRSPGEGALDGPGGHPGT